MGLLFRLVDGIPKSRSGNWRPTASDSGNRVRGGDIEGADLDDEPNLEFTNPMSRKGSDGHQNLLFLSVPEICRFTAWLHVGGILLAPQITLKHPKSRLLGALNTIKRNAVKDPATIVVSNIRKEIYVCYLWYVG
jgi:hypothetical protein